VVILCHTDHDVVAGILRKAQDLDMMNGDYIWFIYTDFVSDSELKPWTMSNAFQGSDFQYRLTAFYAVKLVSYNSSACTSYIGTTPLLLLLLLLQQLLRSS